MRRLTPIRSSLFAGILETPKRRTRTAKSLMVARALTQGEPSH